MKTVALATDHAGFKEKEELKAFLEEKGFEVVDHGAYEFDENDDYPDFIIPLAKDISNNSELFGIVLGGSGTGEAMVCNRFKGVRAVSYYGNNEDIIELSREHNNANVLSFGARFVEVADIKRIALKWLNLDFPGDERHVRRLDKIDQI